MGTNVGNPVIADDRENNRLTYRLGGTDAASFSIVATTGQIQTGTEVDEETKSRYTVTVTANDGRVNSQLQSR